MPWVKRKIDEHVCKKPAHDNTIHVGDIWSCSDCPAMYRVYRIDAAGRGGYLDEWYPASLVWERVEDGR